MNSWYRIATVSACAALLVLLVVVAGCSSTGTTGTAQPTPPLPSNMANVIAIKDFVFNPSSLTIKAGSTVSWVNQGSAPHQVVSDKSSAVQFSSKELQTGGSYSFTFTKPGTYPYHCSIHPSMVATIIVEQ
jgi:plastocyanin